MNCAICNTKAEKKKGLIKCGNCGHTQTVVPEKKNIEFQKHYHLSSKCRTLKLKDGRVPKSFHKDREAICNKRVDIIKDRLSIDYKLLDVGGSCGTFAMHVNPYVGNVEITDLADYQKKESERLGFKFYQGNFLKLDFTNIYDIVTAWHVLEHVNDVNAFVEKCKNLSRKYVVIEVPTERRIQTTVESDGHIHYFTRKSLEALISKYFKNYGIFAGIQRPSLIAIMEK